MRNSSMSAPAVSRSAYNRDLNNFGPRIGVAWSPLQHTTVRAGYGLYYDYIPQHLMIANFTDVAGIATNPVGPCPSFRWTSIRMRLPARAPGPSSQSRRRRSRFSSPIKSAHALCEQLESEHRATGGRARVIPDRLRRKQRNAPDAPSRHQSGFQNQNFETSMNSAPAPNSTYHALQLNGRLRNFHGFSGFYGYVFSNRSTAHPTESISISPPRLSRKTPIICAQKKALRRSTRSTALRAR